MSNKLYLDEIEKLNYYRKQIVDNYLENGIIIDKTKLEAKLAEYDAKMSVFRHGYIAEGETFNLDKFNDQKSDLYADLCILYKVAYKIAREKLSTIEQRIACELEDLSEVAKKYKNKTALETLSVYGNTIYYRTNGFNQRYENGQVIINLGPLSIPSGSYLVCICDSTEINPENIVFEFDNDTKIADYQYGRKYLKVLGNYTINTEELNQEETATTSFTVKSAGADKLSSYNIYAGKNKLKVSTDDGRTIKYVDKTLNIPFIAESECEISFYVYGASTIKFNYAGECEYKSFQGYSIDSPKYRQKILIQAKTGFTLDLATDGIIYADKESCFVSEDSVICPKGYSGISDFLLEEIAYGDDVTFDNIRVVAKNATVTFHDINYIAFKQCQISELDGELE